MSVHNELPDISSFAMVGFYAMSIDYIEKLKF